MPSSDRPRWALTVSAKLSSSATFWMFSLTDVRGLRIPGGSVAALGAPAVPVDQPVEGLGDAPGQDGRPEDPQDKSPGADEQEHLLDLPQLGVHGLEGHADLDRRPFFGVILRQNGNLDLANPDSPALELNLHFFGKGGIIAGRSVRDAAPLVDIPPGPNKLGVELSLVRPVIKDEGGHVVA